MRHINSSVHFSAIPFLHIVEVSCSNKCFMLFVVLQMTISFVCAVKLISVLLMRNSKSAINQPAGPFVCLHCSASRKRAHESARGYFTRCSHILNQIYNRVCACLCVRRTVRQGQQVTRLPHLLLSLYLLWIKVECAPLIDKESAWKSQDSRQQLFPLTQRQSVSW